LETRNKSVGFKKDFDIGSGKRPGREGETPLSELGRKYLGNLNYALRTTLEDTSGDLDG